jgi:hypothetical protein
VQAGLANQLTAGSQQRLNHLGMALGVRRMFKGAAGSTSGMASHIDGVFHHHTGAMLTERQLLDHYRHLLHPLLFRLIGRTAGRAAIHVNPESEELRELSIELSPKKECVDSVHFRYLEHHSRAVR